MLHETMLYRGEVNDSAGTGEPAPALIKNTEKQFNITHEMIVIADGRQGERIKETPSV